MRPTAVQVVPGRYSVEAGDEAKDLNELQYQAYSSYALVVL